MLVIDRFEGDLAVCECDEGTVHIPRSDLPAPAAEGDVIIQTSGGAYAIDECESARRRARIAGRFSALIGNRHES